MNNPKCPYCGAEMRPGGVNTIIHVAWWHCPECKSVGPSCRAEDQKTAVETALSAAMQRYVEPNRVLTLEEVRDRGGCPVWCEDRDGSGAWALVDNGEDRCTDADYGDWEFYCYGWTNERGWRAWTSKPADEERKAVAWDES